MKKILRSFVLFIFCFTALFSFDVYHAPPVKAATIYGPYTFDADNDADESAWTFVSDNGSNGLNPPDTRRAWAHDTNDTTSNGVGPTSGQGGSPDGYIYTEASSPAALNDTFHTTFNTVLDASANAWEIEFYWNQRGDSNTATIKVQTNENGAGWVDRGTYATGGPDVPSYGTQVWNYENLDLTGVISNASTQVRLYVTFPGSGTSWHNDIGIDTITITGTASSTGPNAPALHNVPFNNEKTGDSTPNFEFTAEDQDGTADIIYHIQVDDDYAFGSPLINCESDTSCAAGSGTFINTVNGGDTNPFTEGEKISFTPTTTMTTGTTYYWRVRAEDDSAGGGSGSYGDWTSIQSLTYVSGTGTSEWHQTTDEQFDTGTLSDTSTSGSDSVELDGVGGSASIAIYREATASDTITTANFDHNWDTTVRQDGNYSLSGSDITLTNAGHYLALYGSRFDSTGGSNRSEIQSQLRLGGADLETGWSQCYIRRSNGANECITSGGGIINVSASDTLGLRSFRTDSNSSAGVQRASNASGIQVVKLNDDWDYLRLSKSGTQTGPTSSSWVDVTYNVQDEYDTGSFTHTSGSANITLDTAGHYMVFANTYGTIGTSSDRSLVRQRLTLNGAEVDGSLSNIYLRGSNNTSEGATSIGTIIETTSASQVLNVELNRGDGTTSFTINQNESGATVDRTAITIVKLPDTGDFIRLDDSGADNLNPATLTPLGWNTEDEVDSASFTHPATDSRIEVEVADDYLFFTNNYCAGCGIARGYFNQGWTINDGSLIQYAQSGRYNRNSGANDAGNWSGFIGSSLSANDYVQVESQQLGNSGTMSNDEKGVQGLSLGSILSVGSGTIMSPEIDFDLVPGPGAWGEASFSTAETNGDVKLRVYYTSSTACDTIVPDGVLPGNSSGFDVTASPIDLSGLSPVATTYNNICLEATLINSGGTPYLNDWTISWGTSNTVPVATIPTSITQSTTGSGYLTFETTISDLDSDETRLKVEYSDDGGTTWYDPDLASVQFDNGSVDLDDANPYQIGTVNGIDTDDYADITLTITWDTKSASNGNGSLDDTDQTDIRVRVTPNDNTADGDLKESADFEVDNLDPAGLTALTAGTTTSTSQVLNWSAVTEANFNHYEIWYGENQSDVQNRVGGATEWDAGDDAALATISTTTTTITGLSGNTTYYFKIFAVDDFGNEQTVPDINTSTGNFFATINQVELFYENGNPKFRIDYTLTEDGSTPCNFTTDSTQVQYGPDPGGPWTDASIYGTTTGADSSPGGTAHTLLNEPLFWNATGVADGDYYVQIKPHNGSEYAADYAISAATVEVYTPTQADLMRHGKFVIEGVIYYITQ